MTQVIAGSEVYRALSDLARRYQFRSRDEICCYGLTVSQCYALEYLAEETSVPTSKLAEYLGLDLSTTTRLVDQLVRKKLAARSRGEDDSRVKKIKATDAGVKIAHRVQEDLSALIATALADVPESVVKALPSALTKITYALNNSCSSSGSIYKIKN